MKLEINEIEKVRMLLDCIYCMTNHIGEYPQYGFADIQKMAEMAQDIESQVNKKLSNVERALHSASSAPSDTKPSDDYKGFGDK